VLHVIAPASLPGVLDTLRVTMGWAWTYLVVAELVAASSGLGYLSLKAMRGFQVDVIFLAIAIIGLLGLVTDQLFRFLRLRITALTLMPAIHHPCGSELAREGGTTFNIDVD
jgi:NitT/TauT family transport system permease protein